MVKSKENPYAKALSKTKEKETVVESATPGEDINKGEGDAPGEDINKGKGAIAEDNTTDDIDDDINKDVDYTNLFAKKKNIDKVFVNFFLKEDTYKRLITLAEKRNRTLTDVVETTLVAMLDANNVKVSEKMIESFKKKNDGRGRPRKTQG